MTVIAPKSNEERRLNVGPCCLEDVQLVAATRRENAERRTRKGKGHAATDVDKSGINYCMLTQWARDEKAPSCLHGVSGVVAPLGIGPARLAGAQRPI